MKIIEPSYEILTEISEGGLEELKRIERAARTCYKSEDLIQEDGSSAKKLVQKLINRGHEAMLEHGILSVRFIVDRGVSHELVRHRLASYAQESTRYCNYGAQNGEITVIRPSFLVEGSPAYKSWYTAMQDAEYWYLDLLNKDCSPQQARAVLPNSLKTEVVMTANYREWRQVFKLRTSSAAHPQMVQVMRSLLLELQKLIPIIFYDVEVE